MRASLTITLYLYIKNSIVLSPENDVPLTALQELSLPANMNCTWELLHGIAPRRPHGVDTPVATRRPLEHNSENPRTNRWGCEGITF
jgi:hypothetical protein